MSMRPYADVCNNVLYLDKDVNEYLGYYDLEGNDAYRPVRGWYTTWDAGDIGKKKRLCGHFLTKVENGKAYVVATICGDTTGCGQEPDMVVSVPEDDLVELFKDFNESRSDPDSWLKEVPADYPKALCEHYAGAKESVQKFAEDHSIDGEILDEESVIQII